jgi:hypothetical protein
MYPHREDTSGAFAFLGSGTLIAPRGPVIRPDWREPLGAVNYLNRENPEETNNRMPSGAFPLY